MTINGTIDDTTAVVIIVVILAIVALIGIWRYRRRIGIGFAAGKLKFDMQGENDPISPDPSQSIPSATVPEGNRPGVNIADAEAGDDILADDKTGRGANVERVKTEGGILASSENPPDPKA